MYVYIHCISAPINRSVYRKADVYILDDPLSAVDVAVGRQLFDKCINGLLSDSVVVLVTHQLQYVQKADAMLVIDKVPIRIFVFMHPIILLYTYIRTVYEILCIIIYEYKICTNI